MFGAIVVPAVLYGSAAWVMNAGNISCGKVVEIRGLRCVCIVTKCSNAPPQLDALFFWNFIQPGKIIKAGFCPAIKNAWVIASNNFLSGYQQQQCGSICPVHSRIQDCFSALGNSFQVIARYNFLSCFWKSLAGSICPGHSWMQDFFPASANSCERHSWTQLFVLLFATIVWLKIVRVIAIHSQNIWVLERISRCSCVFGGGTGKVSVQLQGIFCTANGRCCFLLDFSVSQTSDALLKGGALLYDRIRNEKIDR